MYLIDCFKEFSNTTVIENEFELLRHSGGILELESAILSQNIYLIDSTVKRFLRLIDFLSRPSEAINLPAASSGVSEWINLTLRRKRRGRQPQEIK